MFSKFSSTLINSPFGDPALLINHVQNQRSFLFDLGNISNLSNRQILNISHIFITHTHLDHFCGFDKILRLCLGREKKLYLYGPPGFLRNIKGKLMGYKWNLVNHYKNNFIIQATEIKENIAITNIYHCNNRFKPTKKIFQIINNNVILDDNNYKITLATLDHGIPCLAFSFQEKNIIKIRADRIKLMKLVPGPWINKFKQKLKNESNLKNNNTLEIPTTHMCTSKYTIKDLAKKIANIIPGQKITYISDVGYTDINKKKMILLAKNSNKLYIESVFIEKHKKMANEKKHLTAKQAGTIARMSSSQQYILFHYSPRYSYCSHLLKQEAKSAFKSDT